MAEADRLDKSQCKKYVVHGLQNDVGNNPAVYFNLEHGTRRNVSAFAEPLCCSGRRLIFPHHRWAPVRKLRIPNEAPPLIRPPARLLQERRNLRQFTNRRQRAPA